MNENISLHREISLADLEIGSEITVGACEVVQKANFNELPVAVKIIENFSNDNERKDFFYNLAIISMLQHPNLIACLGAHVNTTTFEEKRLIVLDLIKRGTLSNMLRNHNNSFSKKYR